jgi:hypothetical protein
MANANKAAASMERRFIEFSLPSDRCGQATILIICSLAGR